MNLILATGYYVTITIILGLIVMEYIWYDFVENDKHRKQQLKFIFNDTTKSFILACFLMLLLIIQSSLSFPDSLNFSNIMIFK